jgi:energy-coupling factor transport system permease protein
MPASSAHKVRWHNHSGFIARLDIRIKLFIVLGCSVMAIIFNSAASLGILLAASLIYVTMLKRFAVVAVAYSAVAAMMITAIACAQLIAIWVPSMANFKLGVFLFPFLRVLVMLNTVLVASLSTRLQDMLASLKALRLPYFVYLPAAVMLRFIPTFISDARQIRDSLKTKGYPLTPVRIITRPLFTLRLLFVPLVIRALRSSEDLGVAAELKGAGSAGGFEAYGGARFTRPDWVVSSIVAIGFMLAAVVEYGIH